MIFITNLSCLILIQVLGYKLQPILQYCCKNKIQSFLHNVNETLDIMDLESMTPLGLCMLIHHYF